MWGTDLTKTFTGEGRQPCSSRCIIVPPNTLASTPMRGRPASTPWNRSARAWADTSAGSPRASPRVSTRGTITDRNMWDHFQQEIAFLGREFGRLCPRTRGQRLRRAVHPHTQGEPALGPHLRDHRGTAPGAPRIPRDVQQQLADPGARFHHTGRVPAAGTSRCETSGVGFNPVSPEAAGGRDGAKESETAGTAGVKIGDFARRLHGPSVIHPCAVDTKMRDYGSRRRLGA